MDLDEYNLKKYLQQRDILYMIYESEGVYDKPYTIYDNLIHHLELKVRLEKIKKLKQKL